MPKRPVQTDSAAAPGGSYSQGIVAGDFLFISGQGPITPAGEVVSESFEAEVRQTLSNIAAVAATEGKSLADAVRVGVFLNDIDDFDAMDAIYREVFPEPRPARTTIETPLPGFGIEVDAVILLTD